MASRQVADIKADSPEQKIAFRWSYIVLPLALLLISLMLMGFFYRQLPEQVAYHFQDDTPDRWLSRVAFLTWMLLPQVFFTLLAFIVVRLVLVSARYWPIENRSMGRFLPWMGNMVALPQLILTFTMLDIFLYNAYQIKLVPVWVIAAAILIGGGVVLGVFFIQTIREARRRQAGTRQE